MRALLAGLIVVAGALAAPRADVQSPGPAVPVTGVLLPAHGGQPVWNETVSAIAREVDHTHPTEVAFGMASKPAVLAPDPRLAQWVLAQVDRS